jgi:LysM repeat protein
MRIAAILAALVGSVYIFAASGHTAYAAAYMQSSNAVPSKKQSRRITVRRGDYLGKLARMYSTTVLRLFYANAQIVNPNLIYPDEQLQVPAASARLKPRPVPGAESADSAPQEQANVNTGATANSSAAAQAPALVRKSAPAPAVQTSAIGGTWSRLAECESGGDWDIDTGNGFYGGLQFTLSSWRAVGGAGYPNEASPAEQIALAQKLLAIQGWSAWPACSAKLDL